MTPRLHAGDRRRQAVRRRAQVAGAADLQPRGDAGAQADRDGPHQRAQPAGSTQLFGGLASGGANRCALRMGGIKPFAGGGVIGTPTYFPLSTGGLGLAGEAGPEAIVPLARGADGRLGVAMSGAGRRRMSPSRSRRPTRQLPPLRSLPHRPDRARGRARPTQPVTSMTAFHEILFPLDIALKSAGGPERRTDIVALGSGAEERNARWAHSRRRYDAGYGVKTFDALSRGRSRSSRSGAGGFTASAGATGSIIPRRRRTRRVAATDQAIGTGDGVDRDVPAAQDLRRGLFALSAADRQAGGRQRARRGRRHRGGGGHRVHRRCDDRHRDVSRRAHSGERRGGHRRVSCSTCRCASTPTISKSICRPSPPARFRKFRWWRSSRESRFPPPCRPSSTRGVTTLCRCWIITRRDGVVQGFTDHDEDVVLDGVTCRAGSGLTGSEATQKLGLAVDGVGNVRRARRRHAQRGRSCRRALRRGRRRDLAGRLERAVAARAARQGHARRGAARGHGLHRRGARLEPAARRG